jgi:tetratricopeptide (TPR) repeat protein
MKRIIFGIIFSLFVVVLPQGFMAGDLLAEADALYDRGGLDNYKESIGLYLKAVAANPNSYEANWKCARAHRTYADNAKKHKIEGWKDICARYGKMGMKYGQTAKELEPNKPHGHYYYGLSVGIYSDGVSVLTALADGLKSKAQRSLEKAYELDKMYDKAGPIIGLGRFWAAIPWPFRDKKKALKLYREYQATEYFANNDEAKVYLAELLLKLKGEENRAEARSLLEKAAQTDDLFYRDWAKRLLAEME